MGAVVCPAPAALASSCRNDLCEAALGEDANTCPPTTLFEPASIQELSDTVRSIVSSGRKVKPAGMSHSETGVICADDPGDVVRTKRLRDIRIGRISGVLGS